MDNRPEISQNKQNEKTLRACSVKVGYKTYTLELKRNHRGKFVRVTEQAGNYRSTIIVPMEGLAEFVSKLATLQEAVQRPSPPMFLPVASKA